MNLSNQMEKIEIKLPSMKKQELVVTQYEKIKSNLKRKGRVTMSLSLYALRLSGGLLGVLLPLALLLVGAVYAVALREVAQGGVRHRLQLRAGPVDVSPVGHCFFTLSHALPNSSLMRSAHFGQMS